MTRPIMEPNPQRADASLDFATQQLFRRPASGSSIPGNEWCFMTSTTNWASGTTDLDFTGLDGTWDSSFPTFDINGDGNLEIFKPGLYRLAYNVVGLNPDDSSKTYEAQVEIGVVDGPVPDGGSVNDWAVVNQFYGARLPYFLPGFSGGAGVQPDWAVHYENTFGYEDPWYPPDPTPAEFQVHAQKFEDGVDTGTDTGVVVRMWVVRYGFLWTE